MEQRFDLSELADLSGNELEIVNLLEEKGRIRRDELSALSAVSSSELSVLLLNLELKGVIKSQPGGLITL